MHSDPIADLLTRIRNALMAGKPSVDVPSSNLKRDILKIFVEEGFIKKFVIVDDGKQGIIKIMLKYHDSAPVINGLQKVSTPGRRNYSGAKQIPKVLNGLGMAIVSTSKGVVTDKVARKLNCGGEVLCKVW
ncbi:MAG: 30S ribosomal protein S8 [Fibrobacteria bacterium]|nr:30S ribosomal protein S8 [Fibrobacteria bacterium]